MESTKKTQFTRMCITEAILALMENTPYEKITISSVIKKAGVARMTFYNHYSSIYDALKDYLQIICSEYLEVSLETPNIGHFLEYSHILFSLTFFDQYRNYFLTLSKNNLHSIMLEAVNQIMQQNIVLRHTQNKYAMYCYAGGLLNAFLRWEESGKKEDPAEIANLIYKLYSPTL